MINNDIIEDAISPAVDKWNKKLEILNKDFEICSDNSEDFVVTIKSVNNKNNDTGLGNNNPNEGCGRGRACVKQVGDGGKNKTATAPGKHMHDMFMIFEDPPWTAKETPSGSGDWRHKIWEWTSKIEDHDTEIPDTDPQTYYAYIGTAMLHEFGHTLGLPDFYEHPLMSRWDGVMNSSHQILYEDIEQLKAIYIFHNSH